MSSNLNDKAYENLSEDIKALAKKYQSIFPLVKLEKHCPVDLCNVGWPNISKDTAYCHIHGKKLEDIKHQPTLNQVLDRIYYTASTLRNEL